MSFKKRLALSFIRTRFGLLHFFSPRKAVEAAFHLFTTPQYRNRKELPALYEAAESLQFRFQEFDIQGYRWNAAAPRRVLVLHGFESSFVNFEQYVQPLVDRGFCVLGFDAPAHGRSSGHQMNVRIYMEFIEAIRDRFGPIDRFMGHSLGGLSLCLALEEQGHTEGARAVLIAAATETRTAIDMYFNIVRLPRAMRPAFDQFIADRGGHPVEWFSVARAIRNLPIPILWVHDEDDELTPLSDVEPVRRAGLPNVQFVITKGLGHRRIYRDGGVAQKVIDFLSAG
ncbi:MAG: alpha/beta fold hydrolase [Chitinophagaceae bacterium]|nr:MAG: alpha/beta fold hydrolase [Chitinophagaceae bacterium]